MGADSLAGQMRTAARSLLVSLDAGQREFAALPFARPPGAYVAELRWYRPGG